MFKYFPTNYVWNLSVDLAIEMGARIGEIEAMCAPLMEASKQPDAAGNWFWYFNSPLGCHVEYDADMDLHDADWVAREAEACADSSQIFLFQPRDKWFPSGPPPAASKAA